MALFDSLSWGRFMSCMGCSSKTKLKAGSWLTVINGYGNSGLIKTGDKYRVTGFSHNYTRVYLECSSHNFSLDRFKTTNMEIDKPKSYASPIKPGDMVLHIGPTGCEFVHGQKYFARSIDNKNGVIILSSNPNWGGLLSNFVKCESDASLQHEYGSSPKFPVGSYVKTPNGDICEIVEIFDGIRIKLKGNKEVRTKIITYMVMSPDKSVKLRYDESRLTNNLEN